MGDDARGNVCDCTRGDMDEYRRPCGVQDGRRVVLLIKLQCVLCSTVESKLGLGK
jgi:hypothetical protein